LLVAITISGFLALALSQSLAGTIAASQQAESNLMPSFLAHEIIDRLKAMPFQQSLPNGMQSLFNVKPGVYQIPINSDDPPVSGGQPFQAPPLLVDTNNFQYTSGNPSPPYEFKGQAWVDLAQATNGVQATVTITWSEPPQGQKYYYVTTFFTPGGFHD
jgi:hypothetical protein